jgi:hypothetical protein
MPTKLSLAAPANLLLPDQTLAQAPSATPQKRNTILCKTETQSLVIVGGQAKLELGA